MRARVRGGAERTVHSELCSRAEHTLARRAAPQCGTHVSKERERESDADRGKENGRLLPLPTPAVKQALYRPVARTGMAEQKRKDNGKCRKMQRTGGERAAGI